MRRWAARAAWFAGGMFAGLNLAAWAIGHGALEEPDWHGRRALADIYRREARWHNGHEGVARAWSEMQRQDPGRP